MQNQRVSLGLGLVLTVTMMLSQAAFGAEYLVKFKNQNGFKVSTQTLSVAGERITKTNSTAKLATVNLSNGHQSATAIRLAKLLADPNVEYVVPNFKLHAFDTPNDPEFSKQWSLEKVNAVVAWDDERGSKDIVIAVIDTGVDYKHEDLKDNMWVNTKEIPGNGVDDDNNGYIDDVNGWDFNKGDNDPSDDTSAQNPGHGTHCAGIIGAVNNNGKGISGMAATISLMPLRFLGADGSGDLNKAIEAIDYAIKNGAHVISASWGAAVQESMAAPLVEAIERADKAGVIFVAAAANDGKNNDVTSVFPANTKANNVISVAASGSSDAKPQWSNYGPATVDLASPGEGIYSTLPGGKYENLSGTSMATPLVAGLVGLMLSANKDALKNPLAVQSLLQTTGAKVEIETACKCRVDAAAAVKAAKDLPLTVVPAAATLEKDGKLQFTGIGGEGAYTFTVADSNIATITADGNLTGVAFGETKIIIKDAAGKTAESLAIRIAEKEEAGADCPLGDPMICMMVCIVDPTLPWCSGMPELPGADLGLLK